ncbi:MAG: 4-diphosphocytidyl-2-C-methyl-D-erythritol kinase [Pseudonocardiales bacterium]|nr:4-diphosphocytidyl-2-C-methyl-D-erythritol kinase [Pseudonocardiales bacterium]
MSDQQRITVRVPAKINISLAVGPLRADGFHQLTTVFQAVDLYDVVTAERAEGIALAVQGPEATGLAADDTNLAWRAAALLAEAGQSRAGVALHVSKFIPVAAGLAGGSGDAAAALLACDRLWGLGTPMAELDALAARLGSDVTFALYGHTALGTGRGERLSPISTTSEFHWVLAVASRGLSTPSVYRELDRQRQTTGVPADGAAPDRVVAALQAGDYTALADAMGNDLQPAALALAPELARTLEAGVSAGALAGMVAGSGPTCVFLAQDRATAQSIARDIQASGTCRFAVAVLGNVAGARPATLPADQ